MSKRSTAAKAPRRYDLPETIKIGGHAVPLIFTRLDGNHGEFDSRPMVIRLDNSASEGYTYSALLHECIHAIDYFHGMGFDESAVRTLEHSLWALIRDNRELFGRMVLAKL